MWRQEGLKVPQKHPKRGRLWLNEGSCIRLRPERKNHVWSYDLMAARTEDGRALILTLLDEYTRKYLSIMVARRITALDMIYQLGSYFLTEGFQSIFVRTMGRSLRPERFGSG
jgi:putative transposase